MGFATQCQRGIFYFIAREAAGRHPCPPLGAHCLLRGLAHDPLPQHDHRACISAPPSRMGHFREATFSATWRCFLQGHRDNLPVLPGCGSATCGRCFRACQTPEARLMSSVSWAWLSLCPLQLGDPLGLAQVQPLGIVDNLSSIEGTCSCLYPLSVGRTKAASVIRWIQWKTVKIFYSHLFLK